jgi:hypothetical protein
MREKILRDYFDNKVSIDTLSSDVDGTVINSSHKVFEIHINQLPEYDGYLIKNEHLLKLCHDTISGNLKVTHLETIADSLEFSEYFYWNENDTVVGETIFEWANPEINYPLTVENLKKWKLYLDTGEYTLK